MKYGVVCFFLMIVSVFEMKAQVDPNFQIYLCFGQSNMTGGSLAESVDNEVDERFQALAARDYSSPTRVKGKWYPAKPPIVSENNATIGVADYFGRSMVAALPANHRVGVVIVAMGGADIRAFMSDEVEAHSYPCEGYIEKYGGDPYKRLVEMAKEAQKVGVIKGILLHQGEANCGREDSQQWPQWVKTIYERLLSALSLNANEVPLLVGEVGNASEDGQCKTFNEVIAQVPSVIPTAHVIRSVGCPLDASRLHFTALGYRIMGKRYATMMLKLLGYPVHKDANYQLTEGLCKFYKAISIDSYENINLEPGVTFGIPVTVHFEDGHQEDVTSEVVVTCTGKGMKINGNKLTAVTGKRSLVTVNYTDFTGNTVSTSFYVNASNPINGDVNGDDVLDDKDLKALINHIMGKPQDGIFDVNMANINKDDKVDATDVVCLINLMRLNQ